MSVASLTPTFVGLQDPWMPRYVQRIAGSTITVVDLYGVDDSLSFDSPIGDVEPHADTSGAARLECEIRNQTNDKHYRAAIDEHLDDAFSHFGDNIPAITAIVWDFSTSHGRYCAYDHAGNPVINPPSAAASDMMEVYVQARVVQRSIILRSMYV